MPVIKCFAKKIHYQLLAQCCFERQDVDIINKVTELATS